MVSFISNYLSSRQGTFGQVVAAFDIKENLEVAIKIIKHSKKFMAQAQTEISILNFIYQNENAEDSNIVRLYDNFVYRNHQCLVFEMLSHTLYDLLKSTR